jgi:ubiquinone/menaquinone biosynthesis C-methylase UbiE
MIVRTYLAVLAVVALLAGCTSFKRYLYEGGDRDSWQHPERVVQALEIRPGDRVADVGAGGGYFSFRLADAVGEHGTVYAADVDTGMTDYLRTRALAEGRTNMEIVAAEIDDPALPGQVDLIFLCNTYHHIDDPAAYFGGAARYLDEGGRIAIVEYARYGWFQALFGHYTPGDQIRAEMEDAGYRLEAEHRFLPRQSFLIFRAAPRS